MGEVTGDDSDALIDKALHAGIAAIADHTRRLSANRTKKSIRKLILAQIPNDDVLLEGASVVLDNNAICFWMSARRNLM